MAKIKAIELAASLKKLAEHYESLGETKVEPFTIYDYHCGKNSFLAAVKAMPRPLIKQIKDNDYRVIFCDGPITITTYANRDRVCALIQPAKEAIYSCEPLLSPEEDAALTEGA